MTTPDLSSFMSSPEPVIAYAATYIQQLQQDLADHHITSAEFQELSMDQLDYVKVSQDIQDLHRQEEIKAAFDAMITIVGLLAGIVPVKL